MKNQSFNIFLDTQNVPLYIYRCDNLKKLISLIQKGVEFMLLKDRSQNMSFVYLSQKQIHFNLKQAASTMKTKPAF